MTPTDAIEIAQRPSWWRTWKAWGFIAILAVLIVVIVVVIERAGNRGLIPYSTFLDQLEAGNVASVTFQGTEINGLLKHPLDSTPLDTFSSRLPDFGDPTLIQELRKQNVLINVTSASEWTSLFTHLPWPILLFLAVVVLGGLVSLLRGGKVQSTAPMPPMHAMMGLVSGLFAKPQQGTIPHPPHSAPAKEGAATVEMAFHNHPPMRRVLADVDALLASYGDRVSVTRYDFDTPEGEAFANTKELTEHTPLALFVNGSMQFVINGRTIKFYSFPQGQGRGMMAAGNWTIQDLQHVLDEATSRAS